MPENFLVKFFTLVCTNGRLLWVIYFTCYIVFLLFQFLYKNRLKLSFIIQIFTKIKTSKKFEWWRPKILTKKHLLSISQDFYKKSCKLAITKSSILSEHLIWKTFVKTVRKCVSILLSQVLKALYSALDFLCSVSCFKCEC